MQKFLICITTSSRRLPSSGSPLSSSCLPPSPPHLRSPRYHTSVTISFTAPLIAGFADTGEGGVCVSVCVSVCALVLVVVVTVVLVVAKKPLRVLIKLIYNTIHIIHIQNINSTFSYHDEVYLFTNTNHISITLHVSHRHDTQKLVSTHKHT